MEIVAVQLCDAASVRDGLLFVMGGGITKIYREAYPANVRLNLAISFTLRRADLGKDQHLLVSLIGPRKKEIARLEGEFNTQLGNDADVRAGVPVMNHFVLRIPAEIPRTGKYSIAVSMGKDPRPVVLDCWVGPPPEGLKEAGLVTITTGERP